MKNKSKFEINELPTAYFCDNIKSNNLRNELIKNQVRISECHQSNLENIFFSDENISIINKTLILAVFKKTEGQFKIAPQSKQSLIIVMRYLFYEYALHLPYNIKEQINNLNNLVVNDVLSNIITNITQYVNYINEISKPRELLPLPVNVNKSKNLPSVI
jgi:hypothetical protein